MPQVFSPRANGITRLVILAIVLGVAGSAAAAYGFVRSSYSNGVGIAPEQPVPFSHEHHVAGLGIDCRYCHTSVEQAASAGIPPTETCMTCHSQLWTNAEALAPVRISWSTGRPLRWQRVNDVPDFVYFNHSIHVGKGVGCDECHGRVDRMPLMQKAESLSMQWCLDCHRNPAPNLRPRDAVFDPAWTHPDDDPLLGERLVDAYGVRVGHMTHCYVCHR